MRDRLGAGAILVVLIFASTASSCFLTIGTSLGAPSINASRTEGVAPLFVHFSSGGMETEEDSASFLNDEYSWDFGDPSSGTWGTDGKDRNRAKGGVTGHVFERPGAYTVTLTVRTPAGRSSAGKAVITVLDPDEVYGGESTICVSDVEGEESFLGTPAGSRHVVSSDFAQIASMARAGTRILFRRGGSWTAGEEAQAAWEGNQGPVTIGAFGVGADPDAMGIFSNAPKISLSGETGEFIISLNAKRDWRIMDLWLDEPSRRRGSSGINAAYEYRDCLIQRMRISGFGWGIVLSHWNRDPVVIIERNAIVSCDIHDLGEYGIFAGSEELAVMGNDVRDVQDEHVLRVWQAWHSVISHNRLSGASLDGVKADHALKLHGPGTGEDDWLGDPVPGTRLLRRRSDYVVVSDNVFGSCGPWPVIIAPQNNVQNEEISNVVFERNLISAEYGSHSQDVQVSLRVSANRVAIRNNVIDGSTGFTSWTGISVLRYGVEPPPRLVTVYNNSIYRSDNGSAGERVGLIAGADVQGIGIANNLASMPGSSVPVLLLRDDSGTAEASNNALIEDPLFLDPSNADPLLRDFSLRAGSPALGAGKPLPLHEDFSGGQRPQGGWDLGAFEGP